MILKKISYIGSFIRFKARSQLANLIIFNKFKSNDSLNNYANISYDWNGKAIKPTESFETGTKLYPRLYHNLHFTTIWMFTKCVFLSLLFNWIIALSVRDFFQIKISNYFMFIGNSINRPNRQRKYYVQNIIVK